METYLLSQNAVCHYHCTLVKTQNLEYEQI